MTIVAKELERRTPAPGGTGVASHFGIKQVVRAELTKLTSLRSTWVTLAALTIGMLGVTAISVEGATNKSRDWYQGFDPTSQSLTGIAMGVLVMGVLGALAISGEYGSGTIRSSLSAVPRRQSFLLGKVLVIGAVALMVSEILTFSCFGLGQLLLSRGGAPTANFGQPGVLQAVVLSGACLALLGLLALGLGFMVRHTAGAIGAYVGVTFLIPLLIHNFPGNPTRYTPVGILANSVTQVGRQPGQVSPQLGLLLMAIYSAITLAVGYSLLQRRDA